MTKHFLSLAAAAAFTICTAQAQDAQPEKPLGAIRKGTITIGTDIGLANFAMSRMAPGQSQLLYDIRLRPSVGYFVNDHLMLSASVFGGAAQSYGYLNEQIRRNETNIGVSIGGRYYFGSGLTRQGELKKLRFYADAGVGISQGWEKWTRTASGGVSKATNGNLFASLGAGMNYFLTPNVAFESGLSYNRNFPGPMSNATEASVQLNLGLRVFLRKR